MPLPLLERNTFLLIVAVLLLVLAPIGGRRVECAAALQVVTIQSKSWDFRGHHIGYEEAVLSNQDQHDTVTVASTRPSNPPVLLLNGFGVGSFHQHRLFPHLVALSPEIVAGERQVNHGEEDHNAATKDELAMSVGPQPRKVYGIDYLGQGRSWPKSCDDGNSENEKGLIYSIDTWADQIIEFIEEIVLPNHVCQNGQEKIKVHLIGNSVGGHLSVLLACKRPDLIESICLLNATPVWGLNLAGWSGHLPPPFLPRIIGRYLFDRIRDLETIEKYLETAYANRAAFDDVLVKQIRQCTEGKGGHAAFASILYSPPATFPTDEPNDFYRNLGNLECDVLLIFGKEDPWCTPAIGKKMLQSLSRRQNAAVHRYVELDNVGHCPNHESPTAVGHIANRWLMSTDRSKQKLLLWDEQQSMEPWVSEEPWGRVTAREVTEQSASLNLVDRKSVV